MMMWGWYPGGWNTMIIRMIIGVLFWGVAVWLIIRATRVRSRSYDHVQAAGTDDCMEILRRRLAAGQISIDEYERLKEVLGRS